MQLRAQRQLNAAKSVTLYKNKYKTSMSITTDKDENVKELTVEDVYHDENLKCDSNVKEVMKHI